MPRLILMLAVTLPVMLAPATARSQQDQVRTITHQGIERSYALHRPDGPEGRRALVVVLQPLTQTPARLQTWLDPVADRAGFVVAKPSAIDGRWSYWRGGKITLPGDQGEEVDDVGFISEMVAELVADATADPARVFVTGSSRGALMTWTMACKRPSLFAAAAPLSSGMVETQLPECEPPHAMPIFAVQGTDDPVQPYDGWIYGPEPSRPRLLSAAETMEFWRRRNHCTGEAAHQLPHLDPADPTRTTVFEWTGCTAATVLYRVTRGGHMPPALTPNTAEERRTFGLRGRDFETAEEIWARFASVSDPGTRPR